MKMSHNKKSHLHLKCAFSLSQWILEKFFALLKNFANLVASWKGRRESEEYKNEFSLSLFLSLPPLLCSLSLTNNLFFLFFVQAWRRALSVNREFHLNSPFEQTWSSKWNLHTGCFSFPYNQCRSIVYVREEERRWVFLKLISPTFLLVYLIWSCSKVLSYES